MADETPQSTETEQTETNPSTEHQSPTTVVTVYDADGREHFAAPTSKFVLDGLADGTLTEQPPAKTEDGQQSTEEVPNGAEARSAGDDPQPGTGERGAGSGDGSAETGDAGTRRRTGKA
jgi:hypothetical protein